MAVAESPVAVETALEVENITVRFGGITALDDLSFTAAPGQICALIGPNGAGKTTLFNVISRVYAPTEGSIRFFNRDLLELPAHRILDAGIARTFQNLALWPGLTVLENVMVGQHLEGKATFASAPLRIGTGAEDRRMAIKAYTILDQLDLAHLAFKPCAGLPFGTMKRIELARALASDAKLLLLDEPASGLTHSEVDELAHLIRDLRDRFELTVLLVEHHMGMVMGISEKIVVLDFGRKIAEGLPEEVARDPKVIEAYLGVKE